MDWSLSTVVPGNVLQNVCTVCSEPGLLWSHTTGKCCRKHPYSLWVYTFFFFFEQPETFLTGSTLSCMASSVAMTQLKKLWPKYVKGMEGELEKDLQVFHRYHFWILICQIWALLTCEAEAILRAWLLQSKEPAKQASNWDDREKGLGCQLWDVADGSVGSAVIAHNVSMEIHISKVHRSVTHSEVATHFPIDSVRCSWKARRIFSVFDHIKIRTCVQR